MQAMMQASAGWVLNALETVFGTSDGKFTGKFTRGEGYWSSPADEKLQGYFSKLVDARSQRENWYSRTRFISEFFCALSNAGFIYVGYKHKCPEVLFAGFASFLSHSIPKAWLLTADKIGVFVVLTKCVREYSVITNQPWLLGCGVIAALISTTDVYLARTQGITWSHTVWHLSSATFLEIFLRYTKGS